MATKEDCASLHIPDAGQEGMSVLQYLRQAHFSLQRKEIQLAGELACLTEGRTHTDNPYLPMPLVDDPVKELEFRRGDLDGNRREQERLEAMIQAIYQEWKQRYDKG